jgi:hypothetical protein
VDAEVFDQSQIPLSNADSRHDATSESRVSSSNGDGTRKM